MPASWLSRYSPVPGASGSAPLRHPELLRRQPSNGIRVLRVSHQHFLSSAGRATPSDAYSAAAGMGRVAWAAFAQLDCVPARIDHGRSRARSAGTGRPGLRGGAPRPRCSPPCRLCAGRSRSACARGWAPAPRSPGRGFGCASQGSRARSPGCFPPAPLDGARDGRDAEHFDIEAAHLRKLRWRRDGDVVDASYLDHDGSCSRPLYPERWLNDTREWVLVSQASKSTRMPKSAVSGR